MEAEREGHESVRESEQRGRVLTVCVCVHKSRAGFLLAEKQSTEANAEQHTPSADWIFSSTLIKNHIDGGERGGRVRRAGGEEG